MMASSEEKTYCDLLTPVVCGNCLGQHDVNNYCLQCHANICDECKSSHCNTNLTRDHIVLHRTNPEVVKSRRSKKIYCSHHTGKEYIIYCASCGVPCCATCILEEHKGHGYADLEKVISDTESEVDQSVRELERDLIPLYENAISKLKEEANSYQKAVKDVKCSAKGKLQQLRQQLDETEKTFLAEVDRHAEEDMQIIEEKRAELEENLEKVKEAAANGKKAPVDASILFAKNKVAKAKATKPSQITYPGHMSFQTSAFQFSSAFDEVGRISNCADKFLIDVSPHIQHDTIQKENFENTENIKFVKKIDKQQGSSVLRGSDDVVWIHDYDNKCTDIYKDNCSKVKTLNNGFRWNDMAMYGARDVIATDPENKRIMKISSSGLITNLCSTAPLTPYGICMNSNDQIVVGVGGTEGRLLHKKLEVYSTPGFTALQAIEYAQPSNPVLTEGINRVRQTVSGEYVIADSNTIICLSSEWKVKWMSKIGSRHIVAALYCDMDNHILVGNKEKNDIVMLNDDGQLIRTLLTKDDGICEPMSIDMDGKGRLWIGQKDNVLIAVYMK